MTDLTAGVLLLIASFCFGLRLLFLSPKNEGWPPAPTLVRVSLFGFMAATLYQGMVLSGLIFTDEPGRVSSGGAAMCSAIVFYSVAMAYNVYLQRFEPEVWHRIERVMTLAAAPNARVLIALSRLGIYVYMPNRKNDPEPISELDIVDLPHAAD